MLLSELRFQLNKELYLLISVQEEAFPDGAEPGGGQHGAPLRGAGGPGAAEQRHNAPYQYHRVVKSQEETVGEESRQDLQSHKQIPARRSHVLALWFARRLLLQTHDADAPAALIVCVLACTLCRRVCFRCVSLPVRCSATQLASVLEESLFPKEQTLYFILSLIFADCDVRYIA